MWLLLHTGEKPFSFFLSFFGEGCYHHSLYIVEVGHRFYFFGGRRGKTMGGSSQKAGVWLCIISAFEIYCVHLARRRLCGVLGREQVCFVPQEFCFPSAYLPPHVDPSSFNFSPPSRVGNRIFPSAAPYCQSPVQAYVAPGKNGSRTIHSFHSCCHVFPHHSSHFYGKCSPGYKWQSPGRKPVLK